MCKSLAKNSFFLMIYNILNIVFPFMTSMYVARILLPVSIGEVAYAQNVVQYFSILAFLGIPTYGLREIARIRNSRAEMSKIFSELVIINLLSTLIFSVCYYLLILIGPSFQDNLKLYLIVGLLVVFNMFNVSWLYEGLEEFGYIALRNGIFKVIMFFLLVVLVREPDDIISYALVSVVGSAGNGIINVIHSRKYVDFSINGLNLRRHIKIIMILMVVNLAIEIYTLVDTTMLGMMSTKENVAYYTYGSRVNKILLQITNVFTMVLVPRISFHFKQKEFNEFNRLLTKSLKIIMIVAFPMIVGIEFTADFLFPALFGNSYSISATVEKILCFILLVSPTGYLLGSRVMLVSDNESKMIICVGAGAIVNIIGNSILIPVYAELGAAFASVISEIIVAITYIYCGHKVFCLFKYNDTLMRTIIAAAFEWGILFILNIVIIKPSWIKFVVQVILATAVYGLTLILTKEPVILEYKDIFLSKIHSSK